MMRQLTVAEIAEDAFLKSERVRALAMSQTPEDYEDRKKAFVALAMARAEANAAELLLIKVTQADKMRHNG